MDDARSPDALLTQSGVGHLAWTPTAPAAVAGRHGLAQAGRPRTGSDARPQALRRALRPPRSATVPCCPSASG